MKNDKPNTTSATRPVADAEVMRIATAMLNSAIPRLSVRITSAMPQVPAQLVGRNPTTAAPAIIGAAGARITAAIATPGTLRDKLTALVETAAENGVGAAYLARATDLMAGPDGATRIVELFLNGAATA